METLVHTCPLSQYIRYIHLSIHLQGDAQITAIGMVRIVSDLNLRMR